MEESTDVSPNAPKIHPLIHSVGKRIFSSTLSPVFIKWMYAKLRGAHLRFQGPIFSQHILTPSSSPLEIRTLGQDPLLSVLKSLG